MKRIIAIFCLTMLFAAPSRAQEPLSPEVNRMIEYLMLADDAGLDVPLYIMELSDQLAMLSLSNYTNKEIMEQGAAAAELYGHPLVCNNYAAILMKQHKYGSALYYLNKAWKQDKRNAMVATNIARCHFELGDDKNCEAFVNKALTLDPDYGLALQLKASLLLNRGGDKNQQEAVEYILRSALDVWNGISVRQFNSLVAGMEKLYYKYYDALPLMEEKLMALPTPLDGLEKYFKPIARAGRTPGEEPAPQEFPFPVATKTLEYDADGLLGILTASFYGQKNDYFLAAQSVKVPVESGSFPAVYAGLAGGEEFLVDSRAAHITLLAYFFHKIKLLEATIIADQEERRVLDPLEKRLDELVELQFDEMQKEMDAVGMLLPTRVKHYGDEIYNATKDYLNGSVRVHVGCWNKYMKPVMEAYYSDITACLTYVADDQVFEYVQSRFDQDVAEDYEKACLFFLAEIQGGINTAHMLSTVAEEQLEWLRQQEQEYQEELSHSRNRRFLEWDANEKLRVAGMADLNRCREPVPHFTFKLGPYSFKLGVDRSNRIHFRMDSPWESVNRVYNPETGASSTTVLRDVNAGKTPSLEDLEHNALNLNGTVSYGSGTSLGKQVVTDGRGNIIESSNIREDSGSMGLGTSIPGTSLGASGSFSYRKTTAKANRFGASTVPYSARGTLGVDAGYSVGSFNIISGGVGISQGGL